MKNYTLPKLLHGADYNYEQWLDYTEILDSDFELMKKAECNVMSIGIFSWAKLEPVEGEYDFSWMDNLMDRLHENGLKAILATPSGSKPVWMSNKYPEVRRVNVDGKRDPHGYRHNHCRTSPVFRDKIVKINRLLAERYKNHPALLMWHVSNEYNSIQCYCEHCLTAFHRWLEDKYGTIDRLNKAWWTTFWSHTFNNWNEVYPDDKSVHGMMIDWMRFTSDQTLDFFKTESAPLREITPEIPITTNFMVPDVGLDYWSFAPYMDIVSWDSYPEWHKYENEWKEAAKTGFVHDLYRSIKSKPFMLMESSPNVTNWQGLSISKKVNMHKLSSIQAVAHGSDTVQYFQWRQSRGGEEKFHGAVLTHNGRSDTRVFNGVKSVGEELNRINDICGSTTNAEVAIIYDFQNEWALQCAQLANNEGKSYKEQCFAHYEAFWKEGISVDIRDSSSKDLSKYKLVIAPMLYMLRDGFSDVVKSYVKGGGNFVTTYLSGMVDGSDLCFLGGAPGELRELLGIWSEDLESVNGQNRQDFIYNGKTYPSENYADWIHAEGAEVLANFSEGNLDGNPAITRNTYGSGSTYYLSSRSNDQFRADFYRDLIEDLSIDRILDVELPLGVNLQCREDEKYRYIFFMNFTNQKIELDSSGMDLITFDQNIDLSKSVILESYGVEVYRQKKQ